MGTRTGKPRGRPKGAKNKRTAKREHEARRAAEAIEAVIPEAFTGDAHAYLMAIYKDPSKDDAIRLDAAKAAIRYELPALSPVEQRPDRPGEQTITLEQRLAAITRRDAIDAGKVTPIRSPR